MKYVTILACLLLAACHTSRPAPETTPISEAAGKVDSVVVTPHRSLVDKLTGRTPKPYTVKSTDLKVGKKSTVNVYYDPATVTTTTVGKKATAATAEGATATVIGKKAGPSVVASDSSTLNAIEGGGNLAAVNGDDNEVGQKKADTAAPGVAATIADNLTSPLGYVLAIVAVCAVGYGIYYFWWLIPRRKASNDSQA